MQFKRTLINTLLLCSLWSGIAKADQPFCPTKLGEFNVHGSNAPRFGTPLASAPNGAVYVCLVTPQLETVITQYIPTTKQWSSPTVLDGKTHPDNYHTQCSVGISQDGYIHAAYNMHNSPWQYKVSSKPYDIAVMEFKGQPAGYPVSRDNAEGNCTGQCAEDFVKNEPGIASIPGNQISYPHFGMTGDGLYVTHRQCLMCDKSFHDRQWSMGISRYNGPNKSWSRVSGIRPFATLAGKLPIAANLFGDYTNRLHLSLLWCNAYNQAEGGQGCFAHPNFISYAYTDDKGDSWQTSQGKSLNLPLVPDKSEIASGPEWFDNANATGYYDGNTTLTVDSNQKATIVVFPNTTTSDRGIKRSYIAQQAEGWSAPPKVLDYSPTIVYKDPQGRLVAVSSGIRIHISEDGKAWKLYPLALEQGSYELAFDRAWLAKTNQLRLYANNKSSGKLYIWSITFPESGQCN